MQSFSYYIIPAMMFSSKISVLMKSVSFPRFRSMYLHQNLLKKYHTSRSLFKRKSLQLFI